ncbi:MAG: hypothetical protein RR255_00150 [Bacilli bacterium]
MKENEIKIVNFKQVKVYLTYGYQPIRIEIGFKGKLVFVYDKAETESIFYRFIHHEFDNAEL